MFLAKEETMIFLRLTLVGSILMSAGYLVNDKLGQLFIGFGFMVFVIGLIILISTSIVDAGFPKSNS